MTMCDIHPTSPPIGFASYTTVILAKAGIQKGGSLGWTALVTLPYVDPPGMLSKGILGSELAHPIRPEHHVRFAL